MVRKPTNGWGTVAGLKACVNFCVTQHSKYFVKILHASVKIRKNVYLSNIKTWISMPTNIE